MIDLTRRIIAFYLSVFVADADGVTPWDTFIGAHGHAGHKNPRDNKGQIQAILFREDREGRLKQKDLRAEAAQTLSLVQLTDGRLAEHGFWAKGFLAAITAGQVTDAAELSRAEFEALLPDASF